MAAASSALVSASAEACSACASVGEPAPVLLASNPSRPAPIVASWDLRWFESVVFDRDHGREASAELRLVSNTRGWLNDWLGVEATHNAVARWFTVGTATASVLVSGDVDLLARAQWRSAARAHVVGIAAGARLGLAPALVDEFGIARPVQLQVGSGALDFLGQLEYVGMFDGFRVSASARARYATEGRYRWQPGPSLSASTGVRYVFAPWIAAGVSVDVRAALADTLDRAPVEATGGVVLTATPSIAFRLAESLWIAASASVVLGQFWRGVASDGTSATLSVQWSPTLPSRPTVIRPRFLQANRGSNTLALARTAAL